MISFILEGSKINSVQDFHKEIAEIFNFPDFYGKNLDALWDCLTDCTCEISWRENTVIFLWKNHLESKSKLGENYFYKIWRYASLILLVLAGFMPW